MQLLFKLDSRPNKLQYDDDFRSTTSSIIGARASAGEMTTMNIRCALRPMLYARYRHVMRVINPPCCKITICHACKRFTRGSKTCVLRPSRRQEKNSADANTLSDKGCCQDFAHACNVPTFPNISKTVGDDSSLADTSNHMVTTYGRGGLYWPYGGAGALVSAGLVEKVQGDCGTGWDRCTEVFGHGYPTDIQVPCVDLAEV